MQKHTLCLLLSVLLLGSACTPLGMLSGAAAGAGKAAAQQGGIGSAANDTRIQIAINDLWFKYDVDTFSKLDLTIKQGRVLITGIVQKPEARVEAVRLAWQPKGVKQVINEIRVADSEGFSGYATDAWISTRLRTELIFAKDILSVNYSIDTVQGTVYLMGFAQDQRELNHVVTRARKIKGVKGVVSYVKLVGTNQDGVVPPSRNGTAQTTQGKNYTNAPGQTQQDYETTTHTAAPVSTIESEPLPP